MLHAPIMLAIMTSVKSRSPIMAIWEGCVIGGKSFVISVACGSVGDGSIEYGSVEAEFVEEEEDDDDVAGAVVLVVVVKDRVSLGRERK